MRIIYFLAVGLFTFFMPAVHAKGTDPGTARNAGAELAGYLQKADWQNPVCKSFLITFIVNSKGEVLVSSTSEKELDDKIKYLLNYKKISTAGLKPYEVYTLPVTLQ